MPASAAPALAQLPAHRAPSDRPALRLVSTPVPQHLRALERANQVRARRARARRQVGSGELDVRVVLAQPPAELERVPVAELLGWQRSWGSVRVRRLLARAQISELRTVGQLTDRQRRAVLGLLGG